MKNNEQNLDPVLILGGGPTGLGAAFELNKKTPFILLEKSNKVGGLAKTLQHGDSLTDIGPHALHPGGEKVLDCIQSVSERIQMNEIDYSEGIYYNGQFLNYPPSLKEIMMKIDNKRLVICSFNYLLGQLRYYLGSNNYNTFEDFIYDSIGERTAKELNIISYFEKAYGIPPSEVTDIGLETQRLKPLFIKNLFSLLVENSNDSSSLYPQDGIGVFFQAMAHQSSTGKESIIKTNSYPSRIVREGNQITGVEAMVEGTEVQYEPKDLVSTIPLPVLVRLFDPPPSSEVITAIEGLEYRSYKYLHITLSEKQPLPRWHTINVTDATIPFSRVMEPTKFSEKLSSEKGSLFFGLHCSTDDRIWQADTEELVDMCLPWLSEIGLCTDDIVNTYSGGQENAYPVPTAQNSQNLKTIKSFTDKFDDCHLVGRTGSFENISSSQAIEEGMDVGSSIEKTAISANSARGDMYE